jgi:DNA-binding NtrC family response regulator
VTEQHQQFSETGLRDLSILVVEDEQVSRRALLALLAHSGFDASGVGTAEEAYSLVMNNPQMEVLLVDLDLPGMSGADLIDRIEARGGGVLSIIISAADIERLRAISIQRDVAFLRKPLNFGRLLSILNTQSHLQ